MPRVFIGGKFIGGGMSSTLLMDASGAQRQDWQSAVCGFVMVPILTAGFVMLHNSLLCCR